MNPKTLVYYLDGEYGKIWRNKFPPAQYQAGQTLFYKDHNAYGLHVIYSGSVELTKQTQHIENVTLIDDLVAILDYESVLEARPHTFTARVIQPAWISFVDRFLLSELALPAKLALEAHHASHPQEDR